MSSVGQVIDLAAQLAPLQSDMDTLLDSRLTATRAGYLNAAINSRLSAVVKSVQNGSGVSPNNQFTTDITISPVSVGKCLVLFSAKVEAFNNGYARAYVNASNKLRFEKEQGTASDFYYQIVEFW